MLFRLAFRNIFRNFRRTVFTFLAISFGLMMLITMDSLLQGIDKESFKKIIDYETGHIKIYAKGYKEDIDNLPLDIAIKDPQNLIKKLRFNPEVSGIASRTYFRGMLSNGVDELPAIGIAINTVDDVSVFKLKEAILSGSFINGDEDSMLIGEGLAEDFGVSVGDYLTILARTKYDTYQALDLRIKGILRTEDPKIDWNAIVIPLKLAQEALDLDQEVTEISIKLKDINKIQPFKDKLVQSQWSGLEIYAWEELAEDVIAISKMKYSFSILMFMSIVVIALIGISNTILLAAFERTREIGMMAAMGMKRKEIVRLFIYEGSMLGLIGSLVGCIAGTLLVLFWVTKTGLDYSSMLRDMGDVGYRSTGRFTGIWRPGMVIVAFVFGIVVSALASIYPANIASRMEPTEALRKY